MNIKAFVVGGTGAVGSLLVDLLVKNHFVVSATFRKAADQVKIENMGATAVQLDLAKDATPERLARELEGFQHVFFTAGSGNKDVKNVDRDGAIKVAQALASLSQTKPHFIVLSSIGVHQPSLMGDLEQYGQAKREADDAIQGETTLQSTIVRPGALTDDDAVGRILVNGGKHGMPGLSLMKNHKQDQVVNTRADVARVLMEVSKVFGDGESRLFEMLGSNEDEPGQNIVDALTSIK